MRSDESVRIGSEAVASLRDSLDFDYGESVELLVLSAVPRSSTTDSEPLVNLPENQAAIGQDIPSILMERKGSRMIRVNSVKKSVGFAHRIWS